MITDYYYSAALKRAASVFANIFQGLTCRTGKDACGNISEVQVPVRYGATDRVAGAIAAGNTQNNLHSLPMMSVYLRGIDLAPERRHGVGTVDRRTYIEQGAVFPDEIKALARVMPIPYNLTFELAVYASNTDQAFQIIEQILILFDPEVQVQFNDSPFDWTKISRVILESMANEENYPVNTERRVLQWTFNFMMETWLSPPMQLRNDLIKQININIGDLGRANLMELDENGELRPFDDYATIVIDGRDIEVLPVNPEGSLD